MPIFLDRHFIEGATRHTLALAHEKDLNIQDAYGVKFLTYWFDEERSTAFCLVEAPDKSAIQHAHDEAHGDVPAEILEVDPSVVEAFLGRVRDPEPVSKQPATVDSAFRGIMFTDLKDSTLMNTLFGDAKALHLLHVHNVLTRNALRAFEGREVKHTGDGFMAAFNSIDKLVACAISIQQAFGQHNEQNPDEPLYVRIGLSAGEPIEEHGDLFGSAVQLAARLCAHAEPEQILLSEVVFNGCQQQKQRLVSAGSVAPKGFRDNHQIFQVDWSEP